MARSFQRSFGAQSVARNWSKTHDVCNAKYVKTDLFLSHHPPVPDGCVVCKAEGTSSLSRFAESLKVVQVDWLPGVCLTKQIGELYVLMLFKVEEAVLQCTE
jgi:hypothetical protein